MQNQSERKQTKTAAGEQLKKEAKKEEIKTEDAKGSPLKKGDDRVEERAVAANGEGPVAD